MNPRSVREPPFIARAILALMLPAGETRESVLGDLEELFREQAEDPARGMRGAWIWYWRQALGVTLVFGGKRLRGLCARAFAPVGRVVNLREDGVIQIMTEFRLSVRSLIRRPRFTLPALLILATGMTAATAIFTVVNSIVLRPLDFPDSGRLVIVCEDHARLRGLCIASPGNVEDLRRNTRTLSELGIGRSWPYVLTDGTSSQAVHGGIATPGFLRALGVRPILGRLFFDEEHGPDRDRVILLSYELWTTSFGADSAIVESTVHLDGEPYEVVGVLPAGFEVPFDMRGVRLWKPPHFDPLDPDVRGWRGFRAIGRLSPDASVPAATAELRGMYNGLAEDHVEVTEEWRLRVNSLLQVVLGDSRTVLLAFLGAAGILLLIVCANVANLVLARGLERQRELAVRTALGAARGRLVRGFLVESLVLTVSATLVSLVLARGATRILLAMAPPMPRMAGVSMDGRVLVFAALLSVVVTGLFALLPALRVTNRNLIRMMGMGARSGVSRGMSRMRGALVVAELALSVTLLAGAGLLARSFAAYLSWDPGFDRSSLLTFSAFFDTSNFTSRLELFNLFRQTEESIASVPGVLSVAMASAGPLFGGDDGATQYVVQGRADGGEPPSAWWFDAGPGYFRTLGLPVLEGREFTEADGTDRPLVALVNRTLARDAWPDGGAVGELVWLPEMDRVVEVVGVVEDVQPLTPGEATRPELFFSNRQLGRPAPFFIVRVSGDPSALAEAVVDAVRAVDPNVSLGLPVTLNSAEEQALVRPRFQALVLTTFALVALVLSAVGVYAVVSYAVARRIPEMGIRMALGAAARDLVWTILRSSLGVTLLGVGVGLLSSLFVGRLLQGMIHGVGLTDPLSLGGSVLVLLLLALAAAYVPARRVTGADPVDAMRAE
jgi:putative ABC transport system permease protein